MVHSKQVGWERAKKGEYQEWKTKIEQLKDET
jgi:hypothetical protein